MVVVVEEEEVGEVMGEFEKEPELWRSEEGGGRVGEGRGVVDICPRRTVSC